MRAAATAASRRPRPPAVGAAVGIEVVTSAEAIAARTAAIADLAAAATFANATLEAEWLVPLVAHSGGGKTLRIALVGGGDGRLDGVAALRLQRWRWGLPVACLRSWFGDFPMSGTPLLRRGREAATLAALFGTLGRGLEARALLLERLAGDDTVLAAIDAGAAQAGAPWRVLDTARRAALDPRVPSYEAWFEAGFPRKRRKEFRRLKARLAEQGRLEMVERRPGEALELWIAEFLALEAAGWKGMRGAPLARVEGLADFARDSLARFDAAGDTLFWKLALDGRPVAMLYGVKRQGTVWLVKIAYDEAWARFSPGALLTLEATRSLIERGDVDFVDSCAAPGHPMIDHLWRERIVVRDVLVGAPGMSLAAFELLYRTETARRRLRGLARTVYHWLKERL